ncbi:MAG TPA: prepilin-type N-terminal cleavage/methylation domain-containing protein [Methylomirabilota bacterium]|nr:prepilin-type N-terminal cleavage/methylation domain-containing protein [Methylomirabilota bacterium]
MRRPGLFELLTAWRDERGVTVVELLIAVLILAIALIGLAAAIGPAVLATTQGSLQTVAVHLAQDRIEVAKRTAFENDDGPDDPPDLDDLIAARAAVTGFGNFERRVQVQAYTPAAGSCAATPCTGSCAAGACKQVIVSVFFMSGQGEIQTTLSTIRVGP